MYDVNPTTEHLLNFLSPYPLPIPLQLFFVFTLVLSVLLHERRAFGRQRPNTQRNHARGNAVCLCSHAHAIKVAQHKAQATTGSVERVALLRTLAKIKA